MSDSIISRSNHGMLESIGRESFSLVTPLRIEKNVQASVEYVTSYSESWIDKMISESVAPAGKRRTQSGLG